MIQKLPEPETIARNCADENILPLDAYRVAAWCPEEVGKNSPYTQVHLLLPARLPPITQELVGMTPTLHVALRLKSARALDELVGVLLEYRKQVWP
jgi:hypothetical protein